MTTAVNSLVIVPEKPVTKYISVSTQPTVHPRIKHARIKFFKLVIFLGRKGNNSIFTDSSKKAKKIVDKTKPANPEKENGIEGVMSLTIVRTSIISTMATNPKKTELKAKTTLNSFTVTIHNTIIRISGTKQIAKDKNKFIHI